MKCPHCGKEINDKVISTHLARKGGAKSKRTLTPEQARAMVKAREEKRVVTGGDCGDKKGVSNVS